MLSRQLYSSVSLKSESFSLALCHVVQRLTNMKLLRSVWLSHPPTLFHCSYVTCLTVTFFITLSIHFDSSCLFALCSEYLIWFQQAQWYKPGLSYRQGRHPSLSLEVASLPCPSPSDLLPQPPLLFCLCPFPHQSFSILCPLFRSTWLDICTQNIVFLKYISKGYIPEHTLYYTTKNSKSV